ncbi:MAG: pyridoxamine 5'-phosphate oxidase [Chloroflexi bacterium]|nr:pyridoxamine 5'-phosphate oxidase [Chloroflexota bacterium]
MADPRLGTAKNIWVATVRRDDRPHLAPVWFVVADGKWYFVTDPKSVKARNLHHNPNVVLALEDGSNPHIVEGRAQVVQPSAEVTRLFKEKYDWDISTDHQYTEVYEVSVAKRLSW